LPVPAWKIVVEVNDPARLQQTLTTLVNQFNQFSTGNAGKLQLTSDQVSSRTYYSLHSSRLPELAFYYTFVDGYLVAAPSEANLNQAIQNRQTGNTLLNSDNFRGQLPTDSYNNFSAIIYNNVASSLAPLANQLQSSSSLSSEQKQSLAALVASSAPGLICVYGEPDRIVAATRSSFLGFNLGTLAGIQQGRPLLPLIASSAMAVQSQIGGSSPARR